MDKQGGARETGMPRMTTLPANRASVFVLSYSYYVDWYLIAASFNQELLKAVAHKTEFPKSKKAQLRWAEDAWGSYARSRKGGDYRVHTVPLSEAP